MKTKVGLIGLGNVGQLVARNILKSEKYNLAAILDKNPATLAAFPDSIRKVSTPAELANESDIVLTSLPMPPDVKKVMEGSDGLLSGIRKDSIWIDHTTTDYDQTLRFAKEVEEKGAQAMEAPVTGGIALLRQGQMTTLVGGKRSIFEKCKPLLDLSCANVLYMGEIGSATITKVISNMLAGAHVLLMSEAMMLAKRSNLDLRSFFDGIKLSSGNSFVWESEGPLIFNGTYDPEFHIKLHCKDFALGHQIAKQCGSPIPLHSIIEQLYQEARAKYGDTAGSTHPAKLIEDSLGESLQIDGFDDWTYGIETVTGGSIGVVHKKKSEI